MPVSSRTERSCEGMVTSTDSRSEADGKGGGSDLVRVSKLGTDGLPDPHDQGLRRVGRALAALRPQDLLELRLEVRAMQAGWTLVDVVDEIRHPVGGQLPVDERLDLLEYLVTFLGQ